MIPKIENIHRYGKNEQTRRKGNPSQNETREKRSLVWGSTGNYRDDPLQDYPAAVVSGPEFMLSDQPSS